MKREKVIRNGKKEMAEIKNTIIKGKKSEKWTTGGGLIFRWCHFWMTPKENHEKKFETQAWTFPTSKRLLNHLKNIYRNIDESQNFRSNHESQAFGLVGNRDKDLRIFGGGNWNQIRTLKSKFAFSKRFSPVQPSSFGSKTSNCLSFRFTETVTLWFFGK